MTRRQRQPRIVVCLVSCLPVTMFGVALALIATGCGAAPAAVAPSIAFTQVPPGTEGGPERLDTIAGRVTGAKPGQRIVLFARSGGWWVQPLVHEPFTAIHADGTWRNQTHLGTEYAAALVEANYQPPTRADAVPPVGGAVIAVATVKGSPSASPPAAKTITFSGYEWTVRGTPSDRGGRTNPYDASNAWTDASGALHLRIARRDHEWSCAEVSLTRSLGHGSYAFIVRDTWHLEPAAVLGLFTWDESTPEQRYRELDIEISRWGDPANKNAQFVVQPFYVATNVMRFVAPAGLLTHTWRWEPGRISFQTVRGADTGAAARPASSVVASHAFSVGVPAPGQETVRMNLYVYGSATTPMTRDTEVVIEKFVYFP